MGVAEHATSWGSADVVTHYATSGFSDPGEAVALAEVSEQRRGRVLDIAVGGGRTTALLQPEAASYVGLDVDERMIDLARRRFPAADLRLGDAAELGDLPEAAFDLILVSFNSIDVLDHDQRRGAMQAMARALSADGRVVLSSLNLEGTSFDERPWRLVGPTRADTRGQVRDHLRHPLRLPRGLRYYRRTRRASADGPGWGLRPLRAHEFRFVVHFATLGSTVAMLRDAGLEVVSAFTDRGVELDPAAAHTDADYVHYVCRGV